MARTSIVSPFNSFMAGKLFELPFSALLNLFSCFNNAAPTWLLPRMPTAMVMSERVKPSCAARSARDRSARGTTAEMFRSDAPWAMATTLTFALPKAVKKAPLMPGVSFMPSPMTARMLISLRDVARISSSLANSMAKASLTLLRPGISSFSSTATVMECSEEPWEVRITFTPARPRASIILRATPGVPRKEAPDKVTSATFSMDVMAFTGMLPSSSTKSSWSGQRSRASPRP
mmetsp:Transcript_17866/g.37924  ORF Transcript_17866/g.37924 Transcript_17866/m.37924 type:complete len:233 (+) Transcript_17866:1221-1919(+)